MFHIILTGLFSGKTSIKKVIFDKIAPHEVELDKQINHEYQSHLYSFGYCKLNIIEFPSSFSYEKNAKECESFLMKCHVLIFIIDYNLSINQQTEYFKNNILPILNKYKLITLYIFIHKIDNYTKNNILQSQYNEEANKIQSFIVKTYSQFDKTLIIEELKKNFFITSIYDFTLYEAFSTILQNLIPQNQNFSFLIDLVCKNCNIDNAYLFDIKNRFCLACSEKKKVNMFEICLNMIDFAMDMGNLYDDDEENKKRGEDSDNFDEDLDYSLEIKNFKNGLQDSKSIVFFKYVFKNLALISIINKEKYERNNLIDHNIDLLKQGIIRIFQKNEPNKTKIDLWDL